MNSYMEKSSSFEPVSDEEVKHMINFMVGKSCQLPAKLLKGGDAYCLPTITRLVNLSLTK
jgi:hypothetical protein